MPYPAIEFVARHGRKLSVTVGVVAAPFVAFQLTSSGSGVIAAAIAGLIAGLVVWALVRLGSEVIELIAETLMPH